MPTTKKATTKKKQEQLQEVASAEKPKQPKNRFLAALQKAKKAMEDRHSKAVKK